MSQEILVLGGNGKTGRRVAERLRARELPVRIGSRSGEPPFVRRTRFAGHLVGERGDHAIAA